MFPTVREVLELDAVRRGRPKVVAGADRLDTPVRWTHVAELPDIAHLLRGGELLLTTGVALPEDDTALRGFVSELAEVGAAGLVVELGRRFHGALPRALVDAADRAGLVVVELADETPFVRITESVHARIVDAQLAELRASEEVHQAFTELSVEGAEPAEIVRQTARMAHRPVVLENLAHQVLAYDAAGDDPAALLESWEARSRGCRTDGRTGYDPRRGWLVTVVGARGTDWGRLVVATGSTPTTREVMLVERSAATLALNRLVERDRESLERQGHRDLLAGLVTHSHPAAELALRARALGVPLDRRSLVAVVLRPRHRPGTPLEAQAALRDLAEAAAAAVRRARLSALVGAIDDASVGVLLSVASRDRVDAALEALAAGMTGHAADRDATVVAVGSTVDAVLDARRSFLEATQVADAASHQPMRPFYRLPDVQVRGLLQLLRDDARLQTYVERELGPLLAYDAERGSSLVAALRSYLEAGRNKSAAAEAAHLSRPSFYERLGRIESVLGVDLDDVESCLSLHVALLGLDAVRDGGQAARPSG